LALGRVEGIYIGPEPGGPISAVDVVEAVVGRGLKGDRYFRADEMGDPSEEVTLFSVEDLRAAQAEAEEPIDPTDLRRNLMTSGVPLRSLLGARFRIGGAVFEGLDDNPPCAHLQRLAGKPLLRPLARRGGIRAQILEGGRIHSGDIIEVID
jgi:MOSC domain-containing protein YiiM